MADYSDAYYDPKNVPGSTANSRRVALDHRRKPEAPMDYTAKITVLKSVLNMEDLRAITRNTTIPDDATVEFTYVAAEDSTVVEIRWSGSGTSTAQCR